MNKTKRLPPRPSSQTPINPRVSAPKNFTNLLLHKFKASQTLTSKAKLPRNKIIVAQKKISFDPDTCLVSTGKNSNIPQNEIPSSLNSSTPTAATGVDDRMLVVAQAQASLVGFDEINRLIKKLTLSFSAQKNESSFFIKDGLFEGARFHIQCEQRDLSLLANHLTPDAHRVMSTHQDYLRLRLRQKEINLTSLRINS